MGSRRRRSQQGKHRCALVVLTLSCAFVQTTQAQDAERVPDEYVGDWVCQTFTPGYNIVPPHADCHSHRRTASQRLRQYRF